MKKAREELLLVNSFFTKRVLKLQKEMDLPLAYEEGDQKFPK